MRFGVVSEGVGLEGDIRRADRVVQLHDERLGGSGFAGAPHRLDRLLRRDGTLEAARVDLHSIVAAGHGIRRKIFTPSHAPPASEPPNTQPLTASDGTAEKNAPIVQPIARPEA